MNKQEIETMLVKLGVNKSLKGFNMFVDLLLLILEDYKNNVYKTKYTMNDYYYQISIKYDVRLSCVSANIRNAVTTKNCYGDGLTPKDVIEKVLDKVKKEGNK